VHLKDHPLILLGNQLEIPMFFLEFIR